MILKEFIYKFFSNLINFNLYIKKYSNTKYIYSNKISFGDIFTFCIENYFKIKNIKYKIIIFSKLEKKITNFFFHSKTIEELFILIPNFIPTYRISFLLKSKKYFNPPEKYNLDEKKLKVQNKHKNLLTQILKNNLDHISPELIKFQNEKYYLIFIKHYDKNKNCINDAHSRATANLKKVYKLINFLSKNKVIILGEEKDRSYKILKNYYKIKKNIFFFKDLSKNQSMADQLFVHYYAYLALGSASGAFIMSIYLRKKIIFFDTLKFEINKNSLLTSKNIKNLFKKIIYNKKEEVFSDKHINSILDKKIVTKNRYRIKESSFYEIKNAILNFDY
jgi:hypothetical protein